MFTVQGRYLHVCIFNTSHIKVCLFYIYFRLILIFQSEVKTFDCIILPSFIPNCTLGCFFWQMHCGKCQTSKYTDRLVAIFDTNIFHTNISLLYNVNWYLHGNSLVNNVYRLVSCLEVFDIPLQISYCLHWE